MALNAMQRAWMSDEVREMMEIREKPEHDVATRLERAVREAKAEGVREAARKMLDAGLDRKTVLRALDLPADTSLPEA